MAHSIHLIGPDRRHPWSDEERRTGVARLHEVSIAKSRPKKIRRLIHAVA
jgi:hypothetical protein